MSIKTLDIQKLASDYENLYEAVAIAAKRARQISGNIKTEMSERLAHFEIFDRDPEDRRMNDQQVNISLEYERMKKPTELAMEELVDDKLNFRYAEEHPAED